MICDVCHKNEAIIHFKGIFNNQTMKMDLCEECAIKKGVDIKPEFTMGEFISTLSDLGSPSVPKDKKSAACSSCGTTYAEFKQTGRFGCSNCYTTFGYYITPLLEKIHGSTKYSGKRTLANVRVQDDQDLLRQKLSEYKRVLDEMLKKENYEEAANLRDQIKELKKKIKNDIKNT
ncbi:MAG: hypothetical protein A2252_03395 [Elusimicrobia bacterium RIFOXYA2_FULL_39_19]|nr:MAG: hypothetical protein A2252_03395 [Elusimicrobia bacterium RIFOXYA2_FULL_39_19]